MVAAVGDGTGGSLTKGRVQHGAIPRLYWGGRSSPSCPEAEDLVLIAAWEENQQVPGDLPRPATSDARPIEQRSQPLTANRLLGCRRRSQSALICRHDRRMRAPQPHSSRRLKLIHVAVPPSASTSVRSTWS
jgi:hypothetical protein